MFVSSIYVYVCVLIQILCIQIQRKTSYTSGQLTHLKTKTDGFGFLFPALFPPTTAWLTRTCQVISPTLAWRSTYVDKDWWVFWLTFKENQFVLWFLYKM